MTPTNLQLLVALAAVAGAAGIIFWIRHSRAAAKKRAGEKGVEVAPSEAQERPLVADEASRNRIARENREIELALLAVRRAGLAKRREVAGKRVETVTVPAGSAPKPPGTPPHRAEPSEVHEPVAAKEGSPADVDPDPAVAAPDVVATATGNAVDAPADCARQGEDPVAVTALQDEAAPTELPFSMPEKPAAPPEPLAATDNIETVAGRTSFHAAPPDEPIPPIPHPLLGAEIQPVHEAPELVTPELRGLEAVNEHDTAPTDLGDAPRTQTLVEKASPSDVPSVAPVTIALEDLIEAPARTEEAQGDELDEATETDTDWDPSTAAKQQRQYRPVARDPAKVRAPPRREVPGTRDRGCPVEVRVQFAKGGFCRVSLLPRRAEGMPANLHVSGPGGPLDLSEMQDDFYEEVVTPGLGDLLAQGVAWESVTSSGQRYSWALGGREVYVLSGQSYLSGYLNTPRLILNEKHVVLCLATRNDEVLAAIAQTGSPMPTVLGRESGVPENWAALRDVVPRVAVQASQNGDLLDCLRPLPEAQLSFEGGIRLEGNSWLFGFPPQIRVRGDHASVKSLFIGGHEATADATGAFVADGWDAIGEHVVSASVGTKTYTIEGEQEDWQPWIAHAWSLGEEVGVDEFQRPSICGAMVQAPRAAAATGRAIVVPASNSILIGEAPGEIEICRPHSESVNKLCIGFPNFEPVWAIPATALLCNKRTTRVIYLRMGPKAVVQTSTAKAQHRVGRGRKREEAKRAWSTVILDAARKGLAVNPNEQVVVDLWKLYRERARAIARGKV